MENYNMSYLFRRMAMFVLTLLIATIIGLMLAIIVSSFIHHASALELENVTKASLSTDKLSYNLSEPVRFVLLNLGDKNITIYSTTSVDIINSDTGTTYHGTFSCLPNDGSMSCPTTPTWETVLKQGEYYLWSWNQMVYQGGSSTQVPSGNYYGVVDGNYESNDFSINMSIPEPTPNVTVTPTPNVTVTPTPNVTVTPTPNFTVIPTSTPTATPTSTPPSNGGGGGGGNGGSGGSSGSSGGFSFASPELASNIEYFLSVGKNLIAKKPVSFSYSDSRNSFVIYQIDVVGEENQYDVILRLEHLKNMSRLVKKIPAGIIYANENIWTSEKRIDNITVKFRVSNSWIINNTNNFTKEDIKLLRYDGNWWMLNTSMTGNDSKYTYYEAKSLKASSAFAISGLTKLNNLTKEENSSTNSTGKNNTKPAKLEAKNQSDGFTGLVALVSVAVVMFIILSIFRIRNIMKKKK